MKIEFSSCHCTFSEAFCTVNLRERDADFSWWRRLLGASERNLYFSYTALSPNFIPFVPIATIFYYSSTCTYSSTSILFVVSFVDLPCASTHFFLGLSASEGGWYSYTDSPHVATEFLRRARRECGAKGDELFCPSFTSLVHSLFFLTSSPEFCLANLCSPVIFSLIGHFTRIYLSIRSRFHVRSWFFVASRGREKTIVPN